MLFEWAFFLLKCCVIYRITRTLWVLFWSICVYRIIPLFRKVNFDKYKHRWVVVTGCTDGIGKTYTIELAKNGLRKFLLIGRNEEKLNDVTSILKDNFADVEVKHYVFDFLNDDYDGLSQFIQQHDVGFFVNSVGVAPKTLHRFADQVELNRQCMKINVIGTMETLQAVVPSMVKHGGGQIVVLSSSQAYGPIPKLSSYCASKVAISFLTECIGREYGSAGIKVQILMPGLVATKMSQYSSDGLFVVTTETLVKESIQTIGLANECGGCFNHEMQILLRHLFPKWILKYAVLPIYIHQERRLHELEKKRES